MAARRRYSRCVSPERRSRASNAAMSLLAQAGLVAGRFVDGVADVEPFGAGLINDTFFVHCSSGDIVLKRSVMRAGSKLRPGPRPPFGPPCAFRPGALCTFALDSHPRNIPLYNHQKLDECFDALDKHIRIHLETIAPTNCISVPLNPVGSVRLLIVRVELPELVMNTSRCADEPTVTPPKFKSPSSEMIRVGMGTPVPEIAFVLMPLVASELTVTAPP